MTIAAITSCTNTSNPYVLMAAGLLARNAAKLGLKSKPWVKTSLAPGSRVVTDYLTKAGLLAPLESIGFNVVGYGCTTCIGNSGPLKPEISAGIKAGDIVATSVLSGNRNFEGRVHPEVKMNFLASPPLVVAYALAGTMDVDLQTDVLGTRPRRQTGAARQHLALGQGSRRRGARHARLRHVPQELRQRVHRRRQLAVHQDARRQDLRLGGKVHLRAQSALLRRHDHDAAAGHRRHRRALPRACSATRSPPTTSRPPATSPRPARPRSTWCRRACSPWTSIPTARAAAITK